jgi:hypothetical protein
MVAMFMALGMVAMAMVIMKATRITEKTPGNSFATLVLSVLYLMSKNFTR